MCMSVFCIASLGDEQQKLQNEILFENYERLIKVERCLLCSLSRNCNPKVVYPSLSTVLHTLPRGASPFDLVCKDQSRCFVSCLEFVLLGQINPLKSGHGILKETDRSFPLSENMSKLEMLKMAYKSLATKTQINQNQQQTAALKINKTGLQMKQSCAAIKCSPAKNIPQVATEQWHGGGTTKLN